MNSNTNSGETIVNPNEKVCFGVNVGTPEIEKEKLEIKQVKFIPGADMDKGEYTSNKGNIMVNSNPEYINIVLTENTREDNDYLNGLEEEDKIQ